MIIPAYRASTTLPTVLSAAAPQARELDAEVIVVESSADGAAEAIEEAWPAVTVLALPERTLPGRARNIGAAEASGDVLVFLDADAVPDPGWLERLVRRIDNTTVAVAGAIANGTTTSRIGTAGWLLEFSDWLPGAAVHRLAHGASASLAVRSDAFEQAGGFPETLYPGEDTVLTHAWGADGRLAFAPEAVVRHRNRTELADFLVHQRKLGAAFGEVCRQVPFEHGWMAKRPWAAGAGLLRVAAVAARVGPQSDQWRIAARVSPLIVLGLGAWTVGLWTHGH